MNNFDKRYELFCLKQNFDQLCVHIVGKSKDIALYINRYYDTISDLLYEIERNVVDALSDGPKTR